SGKEIIPANINVQQSNGVTREEMVANGSNNQQIQTSNMFAVLEVQEDDDAGRNQLVEVGNKSTVNSNMNLNLTAAVFTPKSTGIGSTASKEDTEKHKNKNDEMVEDNQRDSTVAWVNRAFNANTVATNQSCQEIPSQATEIDATLRNINATKEVQAEGRKIWSQQVEEDSDEGELPEGACGEVESSDEEVEHEEQSVNNNGKEQQLVGNTNKDKQKQVDRPVTNMDGNGIQLIHRDVPPDKSIELQLTEMQHEVRVENIGVSTSIQSCDMAPVKGDIQLTHLIHKDQDKGNALSFLTNIVCFFAGTGFILMLHTLVSHLWVVLAFYAHSQDEMSMYNNMSGWRTNKGNTNYCNKAVKNLLKISTHAKSTTEEQEQAEIYKTKTTITWNQAKKKEIQQNAAKYQIQFFWEEEMMVIQFAVTSSSKDKSWKWALLLVYCVMETLLV
ncbi:hypothetical protein A4A49_55970, partial [Nicotiana attenuata]